MPKFQPVIGLEIHIQLKTRTKMFCSSVNETENAAPNTNICEICTGQPGSLPVANQEAIDKGIMMGLALGCEIPEYSKFDRKNYFYPDLPKGYQISQFDMPVCGRGSLEISVNGEKRVIHITRAHLEEDAGKLLHPHGSNYSLVDLNRAGVPLLEVVTEPDFKAPAEAKIFLQQLRTIARYLNISDADMEKGHLRCDANISLREVKGEMDEFVLPPYKVEIKNMNSFKAVEEALIYEIGRQTEELGEGRALKTETRGWDDHKKVTVSQRSKEGSHDYRYFPEPDLPVLHFAPEYINKLSLMLPELPAAKFLRYMQEYQLTEKIARQLIDDKELAEYFENAVSELKEWLSVEKTEAKEVLSRNIKEAANWCVGLFTELLNSQSLVATESKITPENFAEMLKMIEAGELSKTAAKNVFEDMFATGDDPSNIVKAKGLKQVSDIVAIESSVDRVLADNEKVVYDFKSGKQQALGFLVGKVMAEMKGQANPQLVNEILVKKLK